jgi:hypothetical protein
LAAGFWLAVPAPAQQIIQYNFDNTTAIPPSTTAAPSSMNPNVTGNSIVSGPNLVQDYTLTVYTSQVLRAEINPTATPDETSAVNTGTFWSFTVQPNTGFRMNFTSFTFDAARGGTAAPRTWYLYSSIGGFNPGSAIASAEVLTDRPNLGPFSVSLAGAQFQGLTAPVELRMYLSTPGNTQSLEFDNVTLNGTVVVIPEPSSILVLAACAGVVGAVYRRRR